MTNENNSKSRKWDKAQHLNNVKKSGYFSHVKKSYYHVSVPFEKERFIGIALNQGGLEALLRSGYSEEAIGITSFKQNIMKLPNPVFMNMTFNYRVIYAIRK